MKRALLPIGMVAAMLFVASSASAQSGVNMRWTNCAALAGVANKTFACASNLGNDALAGTFILPQDLPRVSGVAVVMDLVSQSSPLPLWWDYITLGSCRTSGLSIAAYDGDGSGTCGDWALNQASMNIAGYEINPVERQSPGANMARLKQLNAVQATGIVDLVANNEYGAFKLSISHQKTVNSPCGGCTDPVCIVFNSIFVDTETGTGGIFIGNPTAIGSNVCTWQNSGPDCNTVPVRNATWGQVKALYR